MRAILNPSSSVPTHSFQILNTSRIHLFVSFVIFLCNCHTSWSCYSNLLAWFTAIAPKLVFLSPSCLLQCTLYISQNDPFDFRKSDPILPLLKDFKWLPGVIKFSLLSSLWSLLFLELYQYFLPSWLSLIPEVAS